MYYIMKYALCFLVSLAAGEQSAECEEEAVWISPNQVTEYALYHYICCGPLTNLREETRTILQRRNPPALTHKFV